MVHRTCPIENVPELELADSVGARVGSGPAVGKSVSIGAAVGGLSTVTDTRVGAEVGLAVDSSATGEPLGEIVGSDTGAVVTELWLGVAVGSDTGGFVTGLLLGDEVGTVTGALVTGLVPGEEVGLSVGGFTVTPHESDGVPKTRTDNTSDTSEVNDWVAPQFGKRLSTSTPHTNGANPKINWRG